ncbi:DUF4153 domain-containing protein [Ornithinibacillus contaminans]|uniref:DUF4153 domain-containing protein n=1 Tax=Ornithinibacillus contaminans TaxID=694055 RepID=UPI00064D83CB|nr:DUF4173 domain-containing protein [Ornithinibacillus contaminans]
MKNSTNRLLFFLLCLALGIAAEISFFHGEIGISYPIFITIFYAVLFYRFGLSFTHRRIGILLMVMIWILSASYLFFDNLSFYMLNSIVIPVLVFVHIVLITSPNHIDWSSILFLNLLMRKLSKTFKYSKKLIKVVLRKVFKNMSDKTVKMFKRIIIGLLIGLPLLVVITSLLMSADAVFGDLMMEIPKFVVELNFIEGILRVVAVILMTLLFFCVFQVLQKRYVAQVAHSTQAGKKEASWDSVISGTILVLLNSVYVLFVVIQFKYFFGDSLVGNYTYAEYARRGFFELLFVTIVNLSLLVVCLKFVKETKHSMRLFMKLMYSLLVVTSGVMLTSAYQRLSMYEAAYGFTVDRILAHTFMIFLIVIFAYTFIRVWLERISILHFYIIAGLIFYTGLNVVNIEKIIVDNNLDRYEETGKIDVYYLNALSYSGIDGLITLYEQDPNYPDLRMILQDRKNSIDYLQLDTWQSFNFKKQQVVERLQELEL